MKLRKQLSCFGIAVAMSMLLLLGTVAVAAGSNWQMYQSQANQGVQQYALTSAVAAGQPLTISSRLQLDLAGENSSMLGGSASVPEQIVLAGLSTTAGARPTQLAVVWQLDVSSWFPTWNLYLISEADLLPSPNQHLKLDTDVFPLDGEEYSTLFSYDPVSGALSVRVVNETKSAVVYAGNIRVKSTAATLYPGVAAQSADSKNPTQITVQELKTAALFAPVGANVQVKSRIAGTNFLATMRAVDRRDEWVLDVALPSRTARRPPTLTV